jgi:hypothetical protein
MAFHISQLIYNFTKLYFNSKNEECLITEDTKKYNTFQNKNTENNIIQKNEECLITENTKKYNTNNKNTNNKNTNNKNNNNTIQKNEEYLITENIKRYSNS